MHPAPELGALRAQVVALRPDLASARFRRHDAGWDSVAVDVDDRLIFRFPRTDRAAASLRREAAILARLRPAVTLPLPAPVFHDGPPPVAVHDKIPGETLSAAGYAALAPAARDALADALAVFYAETHALDPAAMLAAGARMIPGWPAGDALLADAWPKLPDASRPVAAALARAWDALPPDPHGEVFGMFDCHGDNLAFDHAAGRLNGAFDFGDSGVGPLHRDFIYPAFTDADLMWRIADRYGRRSGRIVDRSRLWLLCGVIRLDEVGGATPGGPWLPRFLAAFAAWAAADQP